MRADACLQKPTIMQQNRPSTREFGRIYDVSGREETRYGLVVDGTNFWVARDRSPGEHVGSPYVRPDVHPDRHEVADHEDQTGEGVSSLAALPDFEPASHSDDSQDEYYHHPRHDQHSPDGEPARALFTGSPLQLGRAMSFDFTFRAEHRPGKSNMASDGGAKLHAPLPTFTRPHITPAILTSSQERREGRWITAQPLPAFQIESNPMEDDGAHPTSIEAIPITLPTFENSPRPSNHEGKRETGAWEAHLPAFEYEGSDGDGIDLNATPDVTVVGALQLALHQPATEARDRQQASALLTASLPTFRRPSTPMGGETSMPHNGKEGNAASTNIHPTDTKNINLSALAELPGFAEENMEGDEVTMFHRSDHTLSSRFHGSLAQDSMGETQSNRQGDGNHRERAIAAVTAHDVTGENAGNGVTRLGLLPAFGDAPTPEAEVGSTHSLSLLPAFGDVPVDSPRSGRSGTSTRGAAH
ncbi:hypothetical protein BDW22DRAFT_1432551 [Trametopsis cervina]|nr:hypothetical protein BDW22DRAFT_1432551 [Trametopsis cervina]